MMTISPLKRLGSLALLLLGMGLLAPAPSQAAEESEHEILENIFRFQLDAHVESLTRRNPAMGARVQDFIDNGTPEYAEDYWALGTSMLHDQTHHILADYMALDSAGLYEKVRFTSKCALLEKMREVDPTVKFRLQASELSRYGVDSCIGPADLATRPYPESDVTRYQKGADLFYEMFDDWQAGNPELAHQKLKQGIDLLASSPNAEAVLNIALGEMLEYSGHIYSSRGNTTLLEDRLMAADELYEGALRDYNGAIALYRDEKPEKVEKIRPLIKEIEMYREVIRRHLEQL